MPMTISVQFPTNPTSEMSADEKNVLKSNKTLEDDGDDSGHEEVDNDEIKDKKFLDDAMRTVLDPNTEITKNNDEVEHFKMQLHEIEGENMTLDHFMESMDTLSLEVCKTSQEALWSYVTNINDEIKKNKMVKQLSLTDY